MTRAEQLFSQILRFLPFMKSSSKLLAWMALRASAQITLLLLLARHFNSSDYGYFVTGIALAALFTPLAGLGAYGAIVKQGARKPAEMPRILGAALQIWLVSTLAAAPLAVALANIILPDKAISAAINFLILSEVASASLVELVARAEQATGHSPRLGMINFGLVTSRLLALIIIVLMAVDSIRALTWLYSSVSIVYSLGVLCWSLLTNKPTFTKNAWLSLLLEGWPFLGAAASTRIQSELNKPIIAQINFSSVGNLNIAQRIVDTAALPLYAMLETISPYLFKHSRKKVNPLLIFVLTPLIAAPICTAIWLFAPLIPLILGARFQEPSIWIKALAALPALQITRFLLSSMLAATHKTIHATSVHVYFSVAAIALNWLLIPHFGLTGAVSALYIGEGIGCCISLSLLTLSMKPKVTRP